MFELAVRNAVERKGRCLVTAAGAALGVACLFGALVTSEATARGFNEVVGGAIGKADVVALPVGSDTSGLDPRLPLVAGSLPDVEAALGVFTFNTAVSAGEHTIERTGLNRNSGPLVVGTEFHASKLVYDFEVVAGRPFARGNEVVLSQLLADQLKVAVGDSVQIATPSGSASLRVVGVIAESGAGLMNEGDVAFTDLGTAQRLAGRGDAVSLIAIRLHGGVSVDEWIKAREGTLGHGVVLQPAEKLAQPVRDLLDSVGTAFAAVTTIVLFVAAFLIYLTLSVSVSERTRTYGILRAVGASPAQIRTVVLAEASCVGLCASLVGIGIGWFVAVGMTEVVAGLPEGLPRPDLRMTPAPVVVALVVGTVTSLIGALVPAWRAAGVSPIAAIRDDVRFGPRRSRSWVVGVVALAAGTFLAVRPVGRHFAPVLLLVLFGSVLVLPLLVSILAAGLHRLAGQSVAVVPVRHLSRERTFAAFTLGLVMTVMAMTIAVGATFVAFQRTTENQLRTQFAADLQLTAASTFEAGFVERLAAVPGVERTTPLSFGTTRLLSTAEERLVRLRAIEAETYFEIASFDWIDGDDRTARDALTGGGHVLVPEALASTLDVGPGETLRLDTLEGPREFAVAGVFSSVGSSASGFSALVVGTGDGVRFFDAVRATDVYVDVAASATPTRVRDEIQRRFGAARNFTIQTSTTFKQLVRGEINTVFAGLGIVLAVGAGVGGLGLGNTIAVAAMRRRREIGVLRAIGALNRQVRGLVTTEALGLVAIAFVLAVPLGLLLSTVVVDAASAAFGNQVETRYPFQLLPAVAGTGGLIGLLASVAPARRAGRLQVVEALRFE